MQISSQNPRVDAYLEKVGKWRPEMEKLRSIVLECGLTEEVKWGEPCYTYNNGNVLIIHGFKEYCALLFFKGALLKDTQGLLIQQTENVQSARQIRFTGLKEIIDLKAVLKAYIFEAIEVEKAGLKVVMKDSSDYKVAAEFQEKLDEMPELKKAFEALTPGRRRAYLLYFSSPKLSSTRESRVEKYIPHILNGKGLDD